LNAVYSIWSAETKPLGIQCFDDWLKFWSERCKRSPILAGPAEISKTEAKQSLEQLEMIIHSEFGHLGAASGPPAHAYTGVWRAGD